MSARPTAGLRREVLPNGVTLLVQRRTAAPAAALVTHVRAGFLDEPDDVVGISHVLEHLVFKGTPRLGPGELARRTKALGGTLNAYTSYDRTVYYATVPSAATREALALQGDSVRDPLVDADELRRELGVIGQEAERKLDTPAAVVGETLHELLYDAHRLRRWRIGTAERIASFTRDEVLGYHRARYFPARVIASLVSDLDEEHALELLRAEWAGWTRPEEPVPSGPPETAPAVLRTRLLPGDVTQVEAVLGWRAPGPLHPDAPALELAAAVLSAGRGARLARLLREPGVVSGIGASHYGADDAGVFAVGWAGEPARFAEALEGVGGAVRALRERAPSDDELARARALVLARTGRRLERYEARATALAAAEALGDVTRLDREDAEIRAVTAARVRDVVAAWCDPAGASAVVSHPQGAVLDGTPDALAAAVGAAARVPPPSNAGPAVAPAAGVAGAPVVAHGVVHLALRGVDVLAARHGEAPQVALTAWRMRHQVEDQATAGIAALALRTMVRGTAARDAAQLALAFERLGGVLVPSVGADALGLGTTVLAEHAGTAAALLAEVLYRPAFAEDQVAVERAVLLEEARAVADDQYRHPVQLAFGEGFADVGYGAPGLGTAASLPTLDAATLRAWHARALAAGRTTVVAVGPGDPQQLAAAVAAAWEPLAPSAPAPQPPGPPPALRGGERVRMRDRRQSAFAMLFPGPSRRDPLRHAAEAWGAIAGGLGGRLFEALRDRRSLAYTVVASSWQRRQAGVLATYIATAPERLAEAREAMLEELAGFRAAPPAADELARAVAMLAGQAAVARQSAPALAGEIADAWLLGDGLADLDDPAAGYRAVTAAMVHEVAQGLDPARMAIGVVAAGREAGGG